MGRTRHVGRAVRYGVYAVVATAFTLLAPPASAAVLPGVPPEDSLLFTLNARSGKLTRDGQHKSRYNLTLSSVDRLTTWFSDRPNRDAGHVSSRLLFESWGRLGFRQVPPNAALVINSAPRKRDTLAFELKLHSYKVGRRQVRFKARRLGSLGNGLAHLNRRLDRHGPLRFRSSSLFIDNASADESCTLGRPQLLPSGRKRADMIPADGRLIPIAGNAALFLLYGISFGGDGRSKFAMPNLTAPSGLDWNVCTDGFQPSRYALAESCSLGEVGYWASNFRPDQVEDPNWLPADGRTLEASRYPAYWAGNVGGQATFQLPDVPAPPGFASFVCVQLARPTPPSISQIEMYVGQPNRTYGSPYTNWWLPANGAQLSATQHTPLYGAIGTRFGGEFRVNFNLPALASPAQGVSYYIAADGYWPFI